PRRLFSDRASTFASDAYFEAMSRLGITPVLSPPYTPQQQGLVERFNRTLSAALSIYCGDFQTTWETHLPSFTLSYNCSKHSSHGFEPYHLFFGQPPTLPADLLFRPENEPTTAFTFLEYIDDVRARAAERLAAAQQQQKAQYDKHHVAKTF